MGSSLAGSRAAALSASRRAIREKKPRRSRGFRGGNADNSRTLASAATCACDGHHIRRRSKYRFRLFDGHNVEVDHNPFVVAAYHHEIKCLAGVKVQLLMRYIRREVDEI